MTTDTAQRQSRTFRQRGAVVLSLFAVLWAAVAASGVAPAAAWPVRIGAVLVAVAIIALALRPGASALPDRPRSLPEGWHRTVGLVNGGQFVLIAVVVAVGVLAGVPQIVPPAVCLVVGLHFLPLARLFDQPQYTATAIGLCVAAVLGGAVLLTGPSLEVSRLVVGGLAALVLWATAVRLALRP